MFKHNIFISFRNLKRNKNSFFINLIGLSTGLACALLIYLWVNDELSINNFNDNDNQLYQVMQNSSEENVVRTEEYTPGILAKSLAEEIPEIQLATSVVPASWFYEKGILKIDETSFKADCQYVDKNYFDVFSCPITSGNKNEVLSDKYNMAISETLALKIFGSTNNVIGKTVEWSQESINGLFQISGTFADPPASASEKHDVILNYEVFLDANPWLREWGNSDPSTFVLVEEGTNVAELNTKIKDFLQLKSPDIESTLFLQKFSDRYLYSRYENGVAVGGRIEYVRLFSIIAIFILVIACINFMNLSTAKASKRFKEIGVKKVVGANRWTLVFQYLSESLLITAISFAISIILVVLLLPEFNEITGKHIILNFSKKHLIVFVALFLITSFISGSYPAIYLSGLKTVETIKGKIRGSVAEFLARKGLVIFQFVISVVLVVTVLVVYKQINFVQSKNLGYNRENIIHFNAEMNPEDTDEFLAYGGKLEKDMETFIDETKKIPGVINAATYYHDLTGNHGDISGVDWKPDNEDVIMRFSNLEVGYGFIETLGIELDEGRGYSRKFGNEISKVIFNEEAIKQMGLDDPIGKTINVWGQKKQIIGVTKNFHFESLFENIKPCIIQLEPRASNIIVRLNSDEQKKIIGQLQQLFQARNPGLDFEYKFMDDDYQQLYVAEKRVGIISRYFAVVAIIISCLGLFGLATFSAEKRTKEISIRKILGASEFGIVQLLSNDFSKMVVTAIIISLPISYIVVYNWIKNFAYRINISWWIFALAGAIALFIALITVSWQSWKAASRNPVEALRYE